MGQYFSLNTCRPNVTTGNSVFSGAMIFHCLAPRSIKGGGKYGGPLVFSQRSPTVRHLVVPTASGKDPEGEGKGNPKVIPRKRTTNLEPKLGENFTYYREHKRWWLLDLCGAIAAMSLTY